MKLSVIIVSYNEMQYLSEAINSCLKQVFDEPYEIIIGDDGSDDGSIDLIKEYSEKNPDVIKWFVMDRPREAIIPSIRVSDIFKKAFSLATGEYLMVMSGDDFLCSKDKFLKQVDFLEHNSLYSACYTDYKRFWDCGKEENVVMHSNMDNASFWSQIYMHISCFMYRRQVLNYILNRFCDDTGLILSILKSGKVKHIPGVMFAYRQRAASIMHEADELELNILEVLLFQDIRNQKGFYFSSLSRFSEPFIYVYKHRMGLNDKKYIKYLKSGKEYHNNYLGLLKDYDKVQFGQKIKILKIIVESILCRWIFKVVRKLDVLFNDILNR